MCSARRQRFAETMLFGEFTGLAGSQRDTFVQPEHAHAVEVADDDNTAAVRQLHEQLRLEAEVPRWQPVWPAFDVYLHAWRARQRHASLPTAASAAINVRRLSSAAHDPLDASDDEATEEAPPALAIAAVVATADGQPDGGAQVAPVVPAAGLELRLRWDADAHTEALTQLLAQIGTSGGDTNATDDDGNFSSEVTVQVTEAAPGVLLPLRLYYYEVRLACA